MIGPKRREAHEDGGQRLRSPWPVRVLAQQFGYWISVGCLISLGAPFWLAIGLSIWPGYLALFLVDGLWSRRRHRSDRC
jgi:hypothetical protein